MPGREGERRALLGGPGGSTRRSGVRPASGRLREPFLPLSAPKPPCCEGESLWLCWRRVGEGWGHPSPAPPSRTLAVFLVSIIFPPIFYFLIFFISPPPASHLHPHPPALCSVASFVPAGSDYGVFAPRKGHFSGVRDSGKAPLPAPLPLPVPAGRSGPCCLHPRAETKNRGKKEILPLIFPR